MNSPDEQLASNRPLWRGLYEKEENRAFVFRLFCGVAAATFLFAVLERFIYGHWRGITMVFVLAASMLLLGGGTGWVRRNRRGFLLAVILSMVVIVPVILRILVGPLDAISNRGSWRLAAAAVTYGSLVLFLGLGWAREGWQKEHHRQRLGLIAILFAGVFVRFLLATAPINNWDVDGWTYLSLKSYHGENAYIYEGDIHNYAKEGGYPLSYPPIWYQLLGGLKHAQRTLCPDQPFSSVVRLFLVVADLVTLLLLLAIVRHENGPPLRTAAFFFLNPVSFLITGFHGQFENLTIIWLLLGLYVFLRLGPASTAGRIALWLGGSFANLTKHSTCQQILIMLNAGFRSVRTRFWLFVGSCLFFLILIYPYVEPRAMKGLIFLFTYTSNIGGYGLSLFFKTKLLKWIFLAGLLVYPFCQRGDDVVKRCLAGLLFFVTFMSGSADQYYIFPIALGALRPSRGFPAYTLVAGIYLLGTETNVCILNGMQKSAIWFPALYWFITLHMPDDPEHPDLALGKPSLSECAISK